MTTFAASQREAAGAFHPRLRKLLARRGFQGHLELRLAGSWFTAPACGPSEHYERLLGVVPASSSTRRSRTPERARTQRSHARERPRGEAGQARASPPTSPVDASAAPF